MTWNKLKWIALVAMLLDHFTAAMPFQPFMQYVFGMDYGVSYYLYYALRAVGRLAFPIFAYGIAQGCVYTRSPKKHLLRLLIFAVLSELPFNFALYGELTFRMKNVFFTLLLGAVCCYLWKYFSAQGRAWVALFPAAAVVVLAQIVDTDYAGLGVLTIFLPYIFFAKKSWRVLCVAACMATEYVLLFNWPLLSIGRGFSEWTLWYLLGAFAGVGLLALYNGKPGSKKLKYFFYAFYPGHLTVLCGVLFALRGTALGPTLTQFM